MPARGGRLAELRDQGLILEDAELGQRTVPPARTADSLAREDRYDLVLVPLRREHLAAALPHLRNANDAATVLFFGNTAGLSQELSAALGARTAFGFPAVGGVQEGAVTRFVLIRQQRTMLGELDGTTSSRIQMLRALFNEAGFSAAITRNMEGWLTAHAAFIVPITFAPYRVDGDPRRLASDHTSLHSWSGPPGRRSRVCGPAGMPRFLQISGSVSVDARVVRHPLLAKANGRPSGRALVRRTWPSRVRRDVLPGGPVAAHDEHHRSSCARPRHLACRQSSPASHHETDA